MGRKPLHDDAIRRMHGEGVPAREIARVVGMSVPGIHGAIRRLGLTSAAVVRRDQNLALLKPLVDRGLTVAGMVQETGLSDGAIRDRLRHLGLSAAPVFDPDGRRAGEVRLATNSRDRDIERMAREGRTHAEMAKAVGISEIRVCAALGRMQLHGARVYAEMARGDHAASC